MNRIDLEVKFATDDTGTLCGYASVFDGEPDSYGDVIAKGAFTKSLSEHKSTNSAPLLLWQHDPTEPIGVWLDLREDENGLAVKGRLVLETRRGQEAYDLLKSGALNGLSIGYRTRVSERRSGGGRILQDLELIEISLVSIPAATRARVTSVKAAHAENPAATVAADKRSQIMAEEKKAAAPKAENKEAEIKALETANSNLDIRLQSVEDALDTVAASAERIEQKLNRPGSPNEKKEAPAAVEVKAFGIFLRQGREVMAANEVKSLRVADDTAGGYLAPADFVAQVIKGIVEVSPVRQAARVGSTSSGEVILPKRTGRPTASWVGEEEESSETGSTYGQVELPIHEMKAHVDVSLRLLEDSAINVQSEVAFDLAEEFGRLEGVALVSGNGSKKPVGFMTDTDIAYTPSGNASSITSPDALISLMYAMPAYYRNSGVWMMNGSTLAVIRKLKDTNNNYIWQPSIQVGQPESILGRPVIEALDMDDVGAGKEPVAFGDFNRAYRIYDRASLSIMRDPYSLATKGLVRFHARRRVGGGVVLAEAIRKLKCATS